MSEIEDEWKSQTIWTRVQILLICTGLINDKGYIAHSLIVRGHGMLITVI